MKDKLATFATITWVLGVSAFIGMLHSWHYVDFKTSLKTQGLNQFISETDGYGVLHFVTPLCSCSKVISEHLLKRSPLNGTAETMIMVDDQHDQFTSKLNKLGYKVFELSTKQVDKKLSSALKGVPLLVIYDQNK